MSQPRAPPSPPRRVLHLPPAPTRICVCTSSCACIRASTCWLIVAARRALVPRSSASGPCPHPPIRRAFLAVAAPLPWLPSRFSHSVPSVLHALWLPHVCTFALSHPPRRIPQVIQNRRVFPCPRILGHASPLCIVRIPSPSHMCALTLLAFPSVCAGELSPISPSRTRPHRRRALASTGRRFLRGQHPLRAPYWSRQTN